jgi:peptidyl-prolyl cis-trans isomerase SurA
MTVLCLASVTSRAAAQLQMVDRIAAVVDDEVILASEVQNYAYFEALNQKINPQQDTASYNRILRRVLDALINQKILLAQARVDSLTVDEAHVDQTLEQQIQERVQQAGGEQALESYLGKSIREIRKLYRGNVRKQLLAQKIQSTRAQDIKVSRSEVEHFYETFLDSLPSVDESIHISHILMEVKPGEEAYGEAQTVASRVLDSLRRGGDFAELARTYSADPGSAKKGGDLGWFNRADFVKEFADAAVKLEPGERSGLVRTQFGYHIIEMIEKTGDKIHVRHILIGVSTTKADREATIERLKALRGDILAGKTTFEDAVLKYSDDPAKKGNLGNLGWIELASFQDKAFLGASRDLKAGELSDVFETSFGLHIVRMNDRRERRRMTLKDDWQTIEDMALRRKQAKEMDQWIQQIRSRFYVDIRI